MTHIRYYNSHRFQLHDYEFAILAQDRTTLVTGTIKADRDRGSEAAATSLMVALRKVGERIWNAQGPRPGTCGVIYKSGTLKNCIKEFLAEYDEANKETLARANDPALALDYELSRHDWYYAFSDDHSVWSGGEAHRRKINEILPLVEIKTAKKIWAKHAPKDCPFPESALAK